MENILQIPVSIKDPGPLQSLNRRPLSQLNIGNYSNPPVIRLAPNVRIFSSNNPTILFLKPDGRQTELESSITLPPLPKGPNNVLPLQISHRSEFVVHKSVVVPPSTQGQNNGLSPAAVPSHNSLQLVKKKSLSLKKNSTNIHSPSVKILEALKQVPKSLPSEASTSSLIQSRDTAAVPTSNSSCDLQTFKAVQIRTSVGKDSSSSISTALLPSPSNPPLDQSKRSDGDQIKILECLLNEILPTSYSHKIVSVIPMHVYRKCDETEMYEAIVRVNISTKEEALEWLSAFQDSSFTDWRVRRPFKENTDRIVFKKTYRCHNNTLAQYRPGTKMAHKKHTECQAMLTLTVKNREMKRSKDKYVKTHPMEIIIQHCHNHSLDSVESLCHRRLKPEVEKKFRNMFSNNHSPSSALKTHLYDIRIEHPENWFEIMANKAECPSLRWCYYQYYKQFQKAYGAPDGDEMLASLSEAIEKYNEECGSSCAAMKRLGNDLVLVICSPLMKRVHEKLKASGEVGFLDSGGCMDRQNTRVFTFLAPSVAGALPAGIIMTSSESEEVVLEAINLLKSILPDKSFHGNNKPNIMMTDDSTSERNALKRAFPGVILLLCLFHILQAFWRYVWDNKHKVPAEDKVEVYFLFKDWCYVDDRDKFEIVYQDILKHPKIKPNTCLVKQITGYYERKEEWALCFRTDLLLRGNNTNNYSERTIKGYKDDVLERVKAYSLVQLFDFFTTRLAAFFEIRISNVLNNRKTNYTQSKHFIDPKKLIPLECTKSSEHEGLYSVFNKESGGKYLVDMDMEVCSCPVGFNGAPCKHQQAVVNQFNLTSSQFLPFHDEQAKLVLHSIMTTTAPRPGWYAPLQLGPTVLTDSVVEEVPHEISSQDTMSHEQCEVPGQTDPVVSETTDNAAETPNHEEVQALAALDSIHKYLAKGVKERPDTFLPAVLKFCERFEKAKSLSENSVISSLHTFNESYSSARATKKGKYIQVRKDQVSRRKVAVGGRKCAPQGRPPKRAWTSEHGYASGKLAKGPCWNYVPPRKRTALPHSLSYKVQAKKPKQD